MFYHQISEFSKLAHDIGLELSDHSEIEQVSQQYCCQGTCQILKWYLDFNILASFLETTGHLVIKVLLLCWHSPKEPVESTLMLTSIYDED